MHETLTPCITNWAVDSKLTMVTIIKYISSLTGQCKKGAQYSSAFHRYGL